MGLAPQNIPTPAVLVAIIAACLAVLTLGIGLTLLIE
jgi:hypothetical protein